MKHVSLAEARADITELLDEVERGGELATLDQALARAAVAEGVPLIGA